jgi:arylsulfatase A-like enzyme
VVTQHFYNDFSVERIGFNLYRLRHLGETSMRRYLTLTVLLASSWTALLHAAGESAEKPNFVFIIADDLGWADVAFHGGNAATPNLDRLVREGLELTQHYVAPVCTPTRAGLLTGRCWSRFGITTPQNTRALPWDTVTLPRALKSVGYDTCITGKWHLGSLPQWGPNHFGFDHSYGSLAGGVSPWNHRYKKGDFSKTWHRNEELLEEPGHVTDLITDEAVQWIEARGAEPFFLYVPFTAVHLPIKEPDEWLGRVPDTIEGDVRRHYAACVMHLDDAVGRIVAALERSSKRENTLLVFTSDNGGSTVENNDLKYPDDNCPNGKLTGNNAPWRGGKGSLYEGGTRVPTIVQWPGRLKPGKVHSAVQIIDWMPTLCSLAGYRPSRNLKWDGVNIAKLLTDQTEIPERPIYTVAPRFRARSLRLGNWKLIVSGQGDARKVELYDLMEDPAEANNQAKQQPDRVRRLLSALDEVAACDRDAVAED